MVMKQGARITGVAEFQPLKMTIYHHVCVYLPFHFSVRYPLQFLIGSYIL